MKKSELSFKCVLPTPKHANAITERLEAIGVYNVEVVKSRFAKSGKTAKFLSLDNKMGFVFGLSDNACVFYSWTEPLMSYEDALKLIEGIETDAPEFDIKLRDEVLVSDGYSDIWELCDFARVDTDCFVVIGYGYGHKLIKYEGNEKYHGTKDTPAGWWECENGKTVWRTK